MFNEIVLNNDKKLVVDEKYYSKAIAFKWKEKILKSGCIQIFTYIKGYAKSFESMILNLPNHMAFIHVNGNPYDFREDNLITCPKKEFRFLNGGSIDKCSRFIGVYKNVGKKEFWAFLPSDGGDRSCIYEGKYNTEEDAAIVVDYNLWLRHGEITSRNFPELDIRDLSNRYSEIKNVYGYTYKERLAKSLHNSDRIYDSKSSEYIGVYYLERAKRYQAYIYYLGKRYHLGYHATAIDAAIARDIKAISLYGKGANLNFPIEIYKESFSV